MTRLTFLGQRVRPRAGTKVALLLLPILLLFLLSMTSLMQAKEDHTTGNGVGASAAVRNDVSMVVNPAISSVRQGENFVVTIDVQVAGSQQIGGVSVYLDFDPAVLQVQSIVPIQSWQNEYQNTHSNSSGQIDYVAGTLDPTFWPYPTSTFSALQVTFRAIADTAGTTLGFHMSNPRNTDVTLPATQGGGSLLTGSTDGLVLTAYQDAKTLLDIGQTFRTTEIQVLSAATIEEALQNYKDFNGGEYFYRFCADYDQIDGQGYCPESQQWPDPQNIRNKLIRARDLFAVLSVAQPPEMTIPVNGTDTLVRELGRQGVLSATREIANIHMIFGHEFLVDALDYRFSVGAVPEAEIIIQQEIDQLNQGSEQFGLAIDIFAYALNADIGEGVQIADYFTEREFQLFGTVSSRMVMSLNQIANRYRQLGQQEQAISVYTEGATAQYIQALALAYQALEQNADFLDNGGRELRNNLQRLRAQVQAIHDGLNLFGFTEEYVPVHPYSDLLTLTDQQFLQDATEDEVAARDAQREFDQNATALSSELQNLRLTYENQLLEMCGESEDDFESCEGGLMEQNYQQMLQAHTGIRLAQQRADAIPQRIANEQQRADQVINLTLENGETISALDYTIALKNSYSESDSRGVTVSRNVNKSVGFSLFPPGIKADVTYSHSRSTTTTKTRTWNPNATEIAHLTSVRTLAQSANQAQIEGANSQAAIRNLLLEQADLMLGRDLAVQEFNQLSAAHNHLVERYDNLLNLRTQAQDDLLDSYLNNPAYRILQDTTTVEASRSHGLAAQFAYLTTKALEYEYLQPVPFENDIFKARTADDIDNFLTQLEQRRVALGSPGQRNRYPYVISISEDLLGFSDQNLDPNGTMTPSQRAQLRYNLFQNFLQQHVAGDMLEFPFTTSIQDNHIFSQNVWNNRIAGAGLPEGVPGTEGVAINILTRQFGDVSTPEVILIHGGEASYRTSADEIVEYTPGAARLVGYSVPSSFQNQSTSATILSSVNGNNEGTPNSALFNLSVAASNWTVRIDQSSPFNRDLDITQIEDIEILLDSTAIALPNLRQGAIENESQMLIKEFEKAKTHSAINPSE